jgi:hypothetical protein
MTDTSTGRLQCDQVGARRSRSHQRSPGARSAFAPPPGSANRGCCSTLKPGSTVLISYVEAGQQKTVRKFEVKATESQPDA